MINTYLFLSLFVAQILVASVLIPRRMLQRINESLASKPPEPDGVEIVQRIVHWYRLSNMLIALIGLVVLGIQYSLLQNPAWDKRVILTSTAYLMLQYLPIIAIAMVGARYDKAFRDALPGQRRKAVLQRRRLFDFVSPGTVAVTLLCYPLFIPFALYIEDDALVVIGIVTFMYVGGAALVYWFLYRMKRHPHHTHAEYLYAVGASVRSLVHTGLAVMVFMGVMLAVEAYDGDNLGPVLVTVFFVLLGLMSFSGMKGPPAGLNANGVTPGAVP
jgi:predicted PurR-regulated permease PerM